MGDYLEILVELNPEKVRQAWELVNKLSIAQQMDLVNSGTVHVLANKQRSAAVKQARVKNKLARAARKKNRK